MRKMLSQYPLFLLTIPGTYLVHVANYYYKLLDWKPVIGELLLYIAIPIVLYASLAWWPKIRQKAGLFIFFFLVVFYFFHAWHEWLNIPYAIHLPLLGIATMAVIAYIIRSRSPYPRFYYAGNLVFCLLLTGGLGEQVYLQVATSGAQNEQADPGKKLLRTYNPCDTCAKPDIYFVILDGYTNSKTLRREFNYENAWIENYLESRKFYIAEHSKSNYYFTQPSLASILNLDYLYNLDTEKLFHTKEFFQSHYTIYNNELCGILEKQGYAINNYSIFDLKQHPSPLIPFLDKLVPRSITGQTVFHKLNRDIGFHWNRLTREKRIAAVVKEAEDDIARINQTLAGVIDAAKTEKTAPQFTYAHFVLPHETFYFDSTGKKTDVASIARKGKLPHDNYITQVAYTNHFVIAPIVDSIFAYAKRPFVIIFQGDHGYRDYPPEKLSLEFENFNALYFPDGRYENLGDSMSSVNTFRIVLNHFFHQRLPLLKDSSVYLKKRVK